jgi:hypothetical protein
MSIPFCPRDRSTQRRSLWASRLSACLKSYQDQCRDTFERLGDYDEAMEFLGNSQTGPLAKTVASVLLRRNVDVDQVVQQELLPRYSQAATDVLGLETVTVETLLQLPRLSDEDLYTPGDYVKLIDFDGWQQYWGSATSTFGTVKRWYRGCIKKVFPPLHVDTCEDSQLSRHLLGRFCLSKMSSSSKLTRSLPAMLDAGCID